MGQLPSSTDELIELAAVVRAHGLRGELLLKPFNPASDLLAQIARVLIKTREGKLEEHAVEDARAHGESVLLTLKMVKSREQAEALRGSLVCVTRADLPALEEDEYYLVDLIGLEARDQTGAVVGKVEDVIEYPSVCCLVVTGDDGSVEVPDIDRYVLEVQVAQGYVVLDNLQELDVLRVGKGEKESR